MAEEARFLKGLTGKYRECMKNVLELKDVDAVNKLVFDFIAETKPKKVQNDSDHEKNIDALIETSGKWVRFIFREKLKNGLSKQKTEETGGPSSEGFMSSRTEKRPLESEASKNPPSNLQMPPTMYGLPAQPMPPMCIPPTQFPPSTNVPQPESQYPPYWNYGYTHGNTYPMNSNVHGGLLYPPNSAGAASGYPGFPPFMCMYPLYPVVAAGFFAPNPPQVSAEARATDPASSASGVTEDSAGFGENEYDDVEINEEENRDGAQYVPAR